MASATLQHDWSVAPQKVAEALRRIIEAANPLQIIAFGSRARRDHRPDRDLDLAVIIDAFEEQAQRRLPYTVIACICIPMDIIAVSKEKYDDHRPWINRVFNSIDFEGIILYDRNDPQQAHPDAVHTIPGEWVSSSTSAA